MILYQVAEISPVGKYTSSAQNYMALSLLAFILDRNLKPVLMDECKYIFLQTIIDTTFLFLCALFRYI